LHSQLRRQRQMCIRDRSRTAIWKAIKELEKKGYQIQHSANGYRYQASDILDAKEIHEGIHQDVDITVLESSTSTMKDAQQAVMDGKRSPLLIAVSYTHL
ncbi:HTH domain-containing protein, partial [Enterococcus sp. S181_ASV_20]|nr:HTH domain-containing protein [Enterococcus sp. S181_ASV_20]